MYICMYVCLTLCVQLNNGYMRINYVLAVIPYFLEKTPRLLFISALPQCGVYSSAAFNSALQVLKCSLVPSIFMRQFLADSMTGREEFVFLCCFM